VYVNELPDSVKLDCLARFRLVEVVHGVTVEKAGAFDTLNVSSTADME
jgi:hypothetical protein